MYIYPEAVIVACTTQMDTTHLPPPPTPYPLVAHSEDNANQDIWVEDSNCLFSCFLPPLQNVASSRAVALSVCVSRSVGVGGEGGGVAGMKGELSAIQQPQCHL